jgi:hypothetical protein
MLSTEQMLALKAYINSQPDLSSYPNNTDGAFDIARLLNAATNHVVWRTRVVTEDVGNSINYVALSALTTANRDRLTTFFILNREDFDPSRADIRAYFADTFSGALGGQGQATRDALEALWRRPANRIEQVFAVGTGTSQSPASLTFEGEVSYQEVDTARNL